MASMTLILQFTDDSKTSGWSIGELKELEAQLTEWRTMLPRELQWEDSEAPPADINAARLRAKYYGARYVIHRPFLHHAIHPMEPGDTPPTEFGRADYVTRPTVSQGFASVPIRGGVDSMPPPPAASYNRIDDTVMSACRNCIHAAMQSTAAFHGINQRPIVTNIFGTAHACVSIFFFRLHRDAVLLTATVPSRQFGNLLVLQAAYRHPILRDLVPREKLTHLLTKTIVFLRNLSPISPTLRYDAEILERSMRPVPHTASSFCSTESNHGR